MLFALVLFLLTEQKSERSLWRDSYDKNTEVLRVLSVQYESKK